MFAWYQWSKLYRHIKNQDFRLKIEQKINIAKQKSVRYIRQKTEELKQLIHENREKEIITRLTPELLNYMKKIELLTDSHDIQKSLKKLIWLYTDLEKRKEQERRTFKEPKQLRKYKDDFSQYEKTFKSLMYKREYSKVQKNWSGSGIM